VSKAVCSVCRAVQETRAMELCPDCHSYVCRACQSEQHTCPRCGMDDEYEYE